jgi:phospholipase/lecithinase/hemolysin
MLPAGCAPPILVMYQDTADPAAYDSSTGCLTELNDLSAHHNALLRQALRGLRAEHPGVDITYADFSTLFMEMVESPAKFGFEGDVLTVCCGGPGRYRFNARVWCGDAGATECEDPSARMFWDGVHLTEAANRYVAGDWLRSIKSPATSHNKQAEDTIILHTNAWSPLEY